MKNTIAVSSDVVGTILSNINGLRREFINLRKEIINFPPYGSTAWWKKAINEAKEDVKKGRYYKAKDAKDLFRYLHS